MTLPLVAPLFALIGFIGFEALKVYKRLWSGQSPMPERRLEYFCVLLLIGVFVSAVAFASEPDGALKAIFLGFSVPASAKAVFEAIPTPSGTPTKLPDSIPSSQDAVDDIDVSRAPGASGGVLHNSAALIALRYYFTR